MVLFPLAWTFALHDRSQSQVLLHWRAKKYLYNDIYMADIKVICKFVILLVFFPQFHGFKPLILSPLQVVYVTATLPYILLLVILIRGLTLPGSLDGVLFYITPDFERLKDGKVSQSLAKKCVYV